jgi:hypothetical protein
MDRLRDEVLRHGVPCRGLIETINRAHSSTLLTAVDTASAQLATLTNEG